MSVQVSPLPGEDLVLACSYDLKIADMANPVRGVWVLFERADTLNLWNDQAFQAEAARLQLALVYAHECDAASFADLQPDGNKGPARALAAALTQLSVASAHPELASASIGMFGFSAAGVLALTVAEAMPERVSAVVTYAAGSGHLELRNITANAALQQVPLLLLANGDDTESGTTSSERFFEMGRAAGAPWTFAVQPRVGHCCTVSVSPLLVAWMSSVVPLRLRSAGGLAVVSEAASLRGQFTCTPDGVQDGMGYSDCAITSAKVEAAAASADSTAAATPSTAWLPTASFGSSWLQWIAVP